MIPLAHLSTPSQYSPDDAVAVWRALLVFLLLLLATYLADRWDKRRERLNDGEERADARRRIREFQAHNSGQVVSMYEVCADLREAVRRVVLPSPATESETT